MPSLFSSRRRGSSANPPVNRSTTSAATAAAGQAFLGRPASSANLSNAAAAAALRSLTSSPEPVGSIQTKRMQRRGSASSAGSGSVIGSGTRGGVGRGGLQRTNSGGSMTERTFRSPSPGRQNSTGAVDVGKDAPPVPPVPENVSNNHRRSASVEPPQRIMSPTPGSGKRGSSVDRASMPPQATSRPAKRLSNVNEEQASAAEPPSSPSRNFSRPMSRDETSTASVKNKYTHGQGSWFTQAAGAAAPNGATRPRTSDGGSGANAPGIEIPITTPRNKKRISSAPGSHLTQANRNSVASTARSDEDDSIMVFDPNTRTFISKPRNRVPDEPESPVRTKTEQVYDRNTRTFISRADAGEPAEPSPPPLNIVQAPTGRKAKPAVTALDTTLQPPPKNPARYSPSSESPTSPRAMGFLNKQPSVVREDREAEEQAEASYPKTKQSRVASQPSAPTPAKSYTAVNNDPHQRSSSLDVPRGEQSSRGRNTSLSPSRSTRFSVSPVTDTTIHNPPGRDVSPVKSALKHSPASSVRANSPMVPPSESDTMSDMGSQDGLNTKRKKSVRVSFDEHAQQIAPAAAVQTLPRDDLSSDDDDAVMKPRPALPSFGSVRSQRMSPEPAEKVTEMPPDRESTSSDAALGNILAGSLRGEGRKVERENSPQDPLPPEVTSREPADYASDASSEADVPAPITDANAGPETATKDLALGTLPAPTDSPKAEDDAHLPAIALQPPTPGTEDDSKKDLQAPAEVGDDDKAHNRLSRDLSMPGGWGDEEEESTQQQKVASAFEVVPEPPRDPTSTQTPLSVAEPERSASHELSDISEDSDDSAAFSDAEEDLSYLDVGGFASLDAIVESPMVTSTPLAKKSNLEDLEEADESPSAGRSVAAVKAENSEGKKPEDWGEATAYWSKLSRQQREQIERDHMSEDDEPKPAPPKAKKKQPSAVQTPTKPALKQTPPQPTQTSSMRKSMRAPANPSPAPADGGVHMRRSMRSGGSAGGGMMTFVREGPQQPRQRPQSEHFPEPKGALQKRDIRPKSSSGLPASASGTAMRQSLRPGSSDSTSRPLPLDSAYPPLPNKRASQQSQPEAKAEPPVVSKRLQKELSKADDSDSESSFRKRRRNRAGSMSTMDSSRGGFSMRKSMRGGPPEPTPAAATPPPRPTSPDQPRGSKWRMRSMSPTGGFFGRSKQTPRPNVDSGTKTTLRAQPPGPRATPTPAARARPSTTSAVTPSASSRFKSRFAADSDDDDDDRPARTFRSRFADSDDEDDGPSNLTPVRGIPKRRGQEDGDSTDLEEEDDDDPRKKSRQRQKQAIPLVPDPSDVEKAMAAARRNLGMSETKPASNDTAQGSALQQGSLRREQQPAGGEPEASPQTARTAAARPPTPEKRKRSFMGSILRRNRNSTASVPQVPASPAVANTGDKTPTAPSSPTDSRPTNKLRRSSYQNQPPTRPKRGDSDLSTATAPEMHHSPGNRDSTNWPLAPPVPKIPEHLAGKSDATSPTSPASPSSPQAFNDAKEDLTPTPSPVEAKGRPSTSDGVSERRGDGHEIRLAKTMRPGGPQRTVSEQVSSGGEREKRIGSGGHVSFLAGDEGSEPGERPGDLVKGAPVYSRRTGKKKKFGMLRRAFGLDD